MSGNSIFVIKPYIWEDLWVFDDPDTGLIREPFVGGADTMLSIAVERARILDADAGFLLFFSDLRFPDADVALTWVCKNFGGNVYRWDEFAIEGWLCPALLKYFPQPPRSLFAHARAIARDK